MPLLPLPNCQRTNRKTNCQLGVILRHNLGWAEAGPDALQELASELLQTITRRREFSLARSLRSCFKNRIAEMGTPNGSDILGARPALVKDQAAKKMIFQKGPPTPRRKGEGMPPFVSV